MIKTRIAVVAVALSFAAATACFAANPHIGTWKVNLAKSTYSPGPKPTVAGTVRVEATPGGGMKTTIDGTNPQGQPTHTETTGTFDGKDNPVNGAPAPKTTTAYKRVNARTFEAMGKVDGKPTVTTRVAISADGKTLTATQNGQTAQGETVKNVIVADRQ